MNRPKRSKDYSEIRLKVQEAALLIAEGKSEKHASWKTGIPRESLRRYLTKGILPDGLPIWPEEVGQQQELPQETGASDSGLPFTRLPLVCPGEQSPQTATVGSPESDMPQVARDSQGRFLPGYSGNPSGRGLSSDAREAKRLFVEACPRVAQKMINVFNTLPSARPDLILAFGKEILDRGLGKAVQAIEVKEESLSIEYQYIQSVITQGDESTIRQLQELAVRMEGYARDNGGAPVGGEVAIIPPPGGTLNNLDLSRIRPISAPDNQHASSARQE